MDHIRKLISATPNLGGGSAAVMHTIEEKAFQFLIYIYIYNKVAKYGDMRALATLRGGCSQPQGWLQAFRSMEGDLAT